MLILSLVLIASLVLEDQLIKLFISSNFAECRGAIRNYFTFSVGDFRIFSITHIRNNGAGWSILGGKTVFLTVATSAVIIAIFVYVFLKRRAIGKFELLSWSLVVAGGLGNLIDRIRMLVEGTDVFSGVIDYIKLDFIDFPVFNFADCCVTAGALMLLIFAFTSDFSDSKKKKAQKAQNQNEPL